MTRTSRALVTTLAVGSALVFAGTSVRTDDPISSNVRFTGEVIRIFARKCEPCHASNGLSMPLSTYRDARAWGRSIREEIVEQRMPPWPAARGYGRFRNDLSLSARETMTVLSWIDGGMPRGDDKDLPNVAPAAEAAAPDLRIALPPQRIPALADHYVQRVTLPASALDPSRAIARVRLAPGSPAVMRGAIIYATAPQQELRWLGAWLPWQHDAGPPDGHAFHLAAGWQFSIELHYRGADQASSDASFVEVYYAPAGTKGIDQVTVAGAGAAPLSKAAALWAIVPSASAPATSLQLTARRPDGSSEILLWMPRLHHDWPQALVLDAPVRLPAGTTVSLITHPSGAATARLSLLQN
jgi:hypothetical protein